MWVGSDLSTCQLKTPRWSTSSSVTDRLYTLFAALELAYQEVCYVLHCLVSIAHAAGVVEEAFIVPARIL